MKSMNTFGKTRRLNRMDISSYIIKACLVILKITNSADERVISRWTGRRSDEQPLRISQSLPSDGNSLQKDPSCIREPWLGLRDWRKLSNQIVRIILSALMQYVSTITVWSSCMMKTSYKNSKSAASQLHSSS